MKDNSEAMIKKADVLRILDQYASIQGVSHKQMLIPKDYERVVKEIERL